MHRVYGWYTLIFDIIFLFLREGLDFHCIYIFTHVFLVLGGSLEIYGAIPEPVLGRISVAVNIVKILLKLAFHVTLHEHTQPETPQTYESCEFFSGVKRNL